ncbi:glycosyltransferase [Myxococcus sp. Y35]|uniref:glycosyltransferase n=1 Tax=Pseudomyxococcus flavus TaxID=3115648 RepID=UPI003CF76422
MARIVFLPLPEAGHIHATFGLAKQLAARGHDIGYMAPPDAEPLLHGRAWPFTPILEDVLPKGYQARLHTRLADPALTAREHREVSKEFIRRRGLRNTEVLFGATFESQLRDSRADLLLVDATFTLPVLAAHKVGIPAFQLCTNLALNRDVAVPPLTSHHIPTGSLASNLRIRFAWQWLYLLTFMPGGEHMRAPVRAFYRRYPDAVPGDFHAHLQIGPHLRVPTLVTCTPGFDFRRATSDHHYLGPCVDRERSEPPLPAELADDDAPLILCSLGSHGDRVRRFHAFFQAVIDAVARRPRWRLLMAVGGQVATDAFGPLPPNVTVMERVPQLTALKRASVMITHGGLNSIKECICLGVPMIAYPLVFDQPGNAARIAHHGLGLRGNIEKPSAERIGAQLDEVLGNPSYRTRVQALQRDFLDADDAGRGAETIERLLHIRKRAAT